MACTVLQWLALLPYKGRSRVHVWSLFALSVLVWVSWFPGALGFLVAEALA